MKRITSEKLLDALVAKNSSNFDQELADLLEEHDVDGGTADPGAGSLRGSPPDPGVCYTGI